MLGEINCKLCMSLSIIRHFSGCSAVFSKRSHYQALGIAKNATQADVKSAYYELSKVYHPDISSRDGKSDVENAKKFRAITEAYEILGNVKKRKLYDKGFDLGSTYSPNDSSTDIPHQSFYKSRETRTRPPPPTGKSTVYNFDEWTRMHYGETFKARQEFKKRQKIHKKIIEDDYESSKNERYFLFTIACLIVIMGIIIRIENHYYDQVTETSTAKKFDNER